MLTRLLDETVFMTVDNERPDNELQSTRYVQPLIQHVQFTQFSDATDKPPLTDTDTLTAATERVILCGVRSERAVSQRSAPTLLQPIAAPGVPSTAQSTHTQGSCV